MIPLYPKSQNHHIIRCKICIRTWQKYWRFRLIKDHPTVKCQHSPMSVSAPVNRFLSDTRNAVLPTSDQCLGHHPRTESVAAVRPCTVLLAMVAPGFRVSLPPQCSNPQFLFHKMLTELSPDGSTYIVKEIWNMPARTKISLFTASQWDIQINKIITWCIALDRHIWIEKSPCAKPDTQNIRIDTPALCDNYVSSVQNSA